MNKLAIRTASIFAAMTAVIILAFAGAMTATAQSAPERPTDLTATATDHDTVSLTWSHPDPATVDHYQVLSRRADSGAGLTQVGTSTTTSFEHDGLEPESTYIYRVRPVNSAGEEGQRSARAEATTPAEETPAPPQRSDDEGQGNIARSSHNVLVSNTGQASNGTTITGNNGGTQTKHAQKFTTGSNPTGYTLDEVRLYIGSAGNASGPVITINSGTGNNPGTVIYTLDNPGTFTSDTVNSFTATSGTTLDADTSYFVVMENTSTGGGGNQRYHVGTTLSNAEDSSGLSDWDIDNDGRTGAPNWGPTSSGVGYSNPNPRNCKCVQRRDTEHTGPAGRVGRLRPHPRPRLRPSDTGIRRHSRPRRWRDNHHPDPERHGRRPRGPGRRRRRPHGRRYHPGRVPGLHRPGTEHHPG